MKRSAMKRTGRLKSKGGSMYPDCRQPLYWKWLGEVDLRSCFCCGLSAERAHVHARGRGGPDWFNVCWLCRFCHYHSEKRPDAFIKESGHDLWASARSLTVEHFQEMNYPEFCVARSEGCYGELSDYLCEKHGMYWATDPREFLDLKGRGFKPLEDELAG